MVTRLSAALHAGRNVRHICLMTARGVSLVPASAGKEWKALVMQSSAAEEGSPVGMLNVAFMLQRGMGYSGPDRYALAYDLNLRAARLEHYADGLVDAAALVYYGDRCTL